MKKVSYLVVTAAMSVATLSLVSESAQARSMQTHFDISAPLVNISLDPKITLNPIQGGTIRIKYNMMKKKDNFIQLVLFQGYYCPPNLFCTMMMPAPYIVKVPLLKMEVDSCGSVIYSGHIDERIVDGNFQELTVRDHTGNKCPTFVALPETGIQYRLITAGMGGPVVNVLSTMTAKELN